MKEENLEKLGLLKDRIDTLSASLLLSLPDNFHIKQIKGILPELSKEAKDIYTAEGGEDIWS